MRKKLKTMGAIVMVSASLICDIPVAWNGTDMFVETALAEEQVIMSGITNGRSIPCDGYRLYYSEGKIVGCITEKPGVKITIPKTVSEAAIPVTEIAANAFRGQTNIVEVVGAHGLKLETLGNSAFRDCTNLKTIYNLGAQIKTISDYCFYNCKALEHPSQFGKQVKQIGDYAFYNCSNLKYIDDGFEADTIGKYAFSRSGFISVRGKANKIGDRCFKDCKKLYEVDLTVAQMGVGCFQNSGDGSQNSVNNLSVKLSVPVLPSYTFSNSGVKSVVLSETTEIEENAFVSAHELSTVVLPYELTYIAPHAFENCFKLSTVKTGDIQARNAFVQNITIAENAFKNTALDYVIFTGNTQVKTDAFAGVNLSFATFTGTTELEDYAIGYTVDHKKIDGFTICSDTPTHVARQYAGANRFSFKKYGSSLTDVQKTYSEFQERILPYFMGTREFSYGDGSCYGDAAVEVLSLTKNLNIFDDVHKVPTTYNGKRITSLFDLPYQHTYIEQIKNFENLTKIVDYYQGSQDNWFIVDQYDKGAISLVDFDLPLLSKLTKLGADCTSIFEIPDYRHVVALFGVQAKTDVADQTYWNEIESYMGKKYDYRLIICDSKYRYRKEADGSITLEGSDADTFDKKTCVSTWQPLETGYLYINSKTGDAFQSVYDSPKNRLDKADYYAQKGEEHPWKEMNYSQITLMPLEVLVRTPDPSKLTFVENRVSKPKKDNLFEDNVFERSEGGTYKVWEVDGRRYYTNMYINPFSDVKDSAWYAKAVMYAYTNVYMDSITTTTFEPNADMTRGMMAQALRFMEGKPQANMSVSFPDVKIGHKYRSDISWAAENKLMNGKSDGTFAPDASITRAQVAIVLWNYAKYKGLPIATGGDITGYKDYFKVSSSAKKALRWAVFCGIINGKENGTLLDPNGTATRAQVAVMIRNFCEKFMVE